MGEWQPTCWHLRMRFGMCHNASMPSWDTRIAIAGLIMAFAGVGITILWPSKRWLGWLCLFLATVLGIYWGCLEFLGRFLAWLWGPHGPWFYMFVGGIWTVLGLIALNALAVAAKRYGSKVKAPKGFLDYKNDAEVAMTALPGLTDKLSTVMQDVGTSFDKHQMLQNAGSTSNQLRVIGQVASQLDRQSARVELICVKFVKTGHMLSDGLRGWSSWLKEASLDKAALGVQFDETLRTFVGTLDTSNNQLREYIKTMQNVKGVASAMDTALDRHIRALQIILDTNINIHNACSQTLSVIDGMPSQAANALSKVAGNEAIS